MVRVEQIIQELQHLTAAPLFNAARTRFGSRTTPAPAPAADVTHVTHVADVADVTHVLDSIIDPLLQPSTSSRPVDSVVASMVDVLDVARFDRLPAPSLPVVPAISRCTPTLPPRAVEIARAASARATQAHAMQVARSESEPQPQPQPHVDDVFAEYESTAVAAATAVAPARQASSSPPSRRQVELAVAATDQLIESLKGEEGVKRLSVRVILRTGDQREVEATAEWEAS